MQASLCCGRTHFETNFFLLLKIVDDLKQITSLRVPGRPEHPHEALGRMTRALRQFVEANGGVNVISQHDFTRLYISRDKALDRLAQQFLPE